MIFTKDDKFGYGADFQKLVFELDTAKIEYKELCETFDNWKDGDDTINLESLKLKFLENQKTIDNITKNIYELKEILDAENANKFTLIEKFLERYTIPVFIIADVLYMPVPATCVSAVDLVKDYELISQQRISEKTMPQWFYDVSAKEENGYLLVITDFEKISVNDQRIVLEIIKHLSFCGQLISCAPALRIIIHAFGKCEIIEDIARLIVYFDATKN